MGVGGLRSADPQREVSESEWDGDWGGGGRRGRHRKENRTQLLLKLKH